MVRFKNCYTNFEIQKPISDQHYATMQRNSSEHRIEDCRYIPSEINVADILSRGISFDKFHLLSTWFTGPEFLVSNNQNYDFEGLEEKIVCDEVRIETVEDHKGNVNVNASNVNTKSISPSPIFWEYYSS